MKPPTPPPTPGTPAMPAFARARRAAIGAIAAAIVVALLPAPATARDLTLDETRALARDAAFDVRRLEAELAALEATRSEAGAALRPRVQVVGQVEQRDRQVELDLPDVPGLDIGTPVVVPGQQARALIEVDAPVVNVDGWHRVRAATRRVEAGHAQRDAVADSLELAAIEVHLRIATLDATLDVARSHVELAERHLAQTVARRDARMATEFDVRRAQAEVAAVQLEVSDAERARDAAVRTLGVLVGGADVTGVEPPTAAPSLPGDLAALVDRALGQRAEVQATALAIEATATAADAERLGLVPDLIVGGQALTSTAEAIDGQHRQWFVQASLVWVPYDRGLRRARAARAEAEQAALAVDADRQHATIAREVADAFAARASADATSALAADYAALAEDAARLAQAALDAGSATPLDVDRARSDWMDARVRLVAAEHERALAAWRLAWACGALEP